MADRKTSGGDWRRTWPPSNTAGRFRYKRIWDNIVTFLQIGLNQTCRYVDTAKGTKNFTGTHAVNHVLQYLEDYQHVEKVHVEFAVEVTRNTALQFCQKMLENGVIVPANASPVDENLPPMLHFQDSKKLYRFQSTRNPIDDLSGIFTSSCRLKPSQSSLDNKSISSKTTVQSQSPAASGRNDIFSELFGIPRLALDGDDMSTGSEDSYASIGSSSSDACFWSYWDTNFSDCMEIWREVCLKRLLFMTDIPCLEKILGTPVSEKADLSSRANSIGLIQYCNLPPVVQAASELLDHMPQFSDAIIKIDPSELHPLTLVCAVLLQCKLQLADHSERKSIFGNFIANIWKDQANGTFLPEHHTELHVAIHALLRRKGSAAAIEALQLYDLLLPWRHREELKRLLKFLHVASLTGVPLLHREFDNRSYLIAKFRSTIFAASDMKQRNGDQLLHFMISNCDEIFGVPKAVKDEVESRIGLLGCGNASYTSDAGDTYKKAAITSESLLSLLTYCSKHPSPRIRDLRKEFRLKHPDVFKTFAESLSFEKPE